jgi:hypothetical protein
MTAPQSIGPAHRATSSRRPTPYRRHNCSRNHRTHLAAAKCIWKRATWILGNGPHAIVARCRPGVTTVTLHHNPETALEALDAIDYLGCGGVCCGRHQHILIAVTA